MSCLRGWRWRRRELYPVMRWGRISDDQIRFWRWPFLGASLGRPRHGGRSAQLGRAYPSQVRFAGRRKGWWSPSGPGGPTWVVPGMWWHCPVQWGSAHSQWHVAVPYRQSGRASPGSCSWTSCCTSLRGGLGLWCRRRCRCDVGPGSTTDGCPLALPTAACCRTTSARPS